MNCLNKTFLFLIATLFTLQARGQYFEIGQDPASVKWQQLKTENFTIIYPVEFTKNVQYLANVLQYVRVYGTKTLGHQPKHLTVILHDRSVLSNGYSLWAPKRSEYITCPPQDNYAQDWLEQLATHEYRHTVQIDMLNRGITKGLTWLFGQQATAAVLGLYVPLWFMEGDAVATETLLSKSGRGRLPSFEMLVRAQVLGYKMFNYDKAVLGSYKDFVPDRYNFGYTMVAGARKKFGSGIWQTAMEDAGKYPFLVTPFNKGIKKVSGLSKSMLYKSIYNDLDSLWNAQKSQITYSAYRSITPVKQKNYTNYKFPRYINDSTVIAVKSGMDDIDRLIQINRKGEEQIIHTPGFYASENLSISKSSVLDSGGGKDSLSNNFIVWTENKFDPRWPERDYSVILLHNIKTGKTKQITRRSRYFAPCLFPDGDHIIAVEITENNSCSLVIIESKTGKVIKKYDAPEHAQFQTPSVSDDGKTIVTIEFNNAGKSIVFINAITGKFKTILQPTFDEISYPFLYKNYLFYNAVYSGIDNIYALDSVGKIRQVTSSLYGAGNADISPDGKKILYTNYTPSGFQLVESDFNPSAWTPVENVKNNTVQLYKSILSQESGLVDSVNIPKKIYEVKKYRKWQHLFNPHSWAPAFIDGTNMVLHPGVSIASQNMLSTLSATLGYDYNLNDKVGKYYAGISYLGWYPIFDLTYSYGKEALYVTDKENKTTKYTWNASNLMLGTRLPLAFSHGKYIQNIDPGIKTYSLLASNVPIIPGHTVIAKRQVMDYTFSASNQIKAVGRDMRPRWGQGLSFEYLNTPFGGTNYGSEISTTLSLLFPGIGRHHSLMILSGYQKKQAGKESFPDLLNYPRGYNLIPEFENDLSNDELTSLSLNYKLPLICPDMRIGSLLYFKRFKANLFYDYAKGITGSVKKQFSSEGLELTTDVNVLRFIIPIDTGVRMSLTPDYNLPVFEFLISVNLGGL